VTGSCACTRGSSPAGVPEGTRQLSRITGDISRDRIEGAGPWVPGMPSPEGSGQAVHRAPHDTTEITMLLSTTPAPARPDLDRAPGATPRTPPPPRSGQAVHRGPPDPTDIKMPPSPPPPPARTDLDRAVGATPGASVR